MKHHALEVFKKAFAEFVCGFARMHRGEPERFFIRRELKGFKPNGFAVVAAFQEQKIPVIRQQDESVMFEIFFDLLRLGDGGNFGECLNLKIYI